MKKMVTRETAENANNHPLLFFYIIQLKSNKRISCARVTVCDVVFLLHIWGVCLSVCQSASSYSSGGCDSQYSRRVSNCLGLGLKFNSN